MRTNEAGKKPKVQKGEEYGKFKQFIEDRRKPIIGGSESKALEAGTDAADLADAATVIIGSELSASERRSLTDDFIYGLEKMSERGSTIIAIAVALE